MANLPAAAAHRPESRSPASRLEIRRFFGPEIMAILVGATLWEAAGRLLSFHFLPPLSAVIVAGAELVRRGAIGVNLLASLTALAVGFGIALIIGITLGALMGRLPLVDIAVGPLVNAMLASPSLIFVPVLFIFFGLGAGTRAAVVFIYSVFIIITNTATAMRRADLQLQEMARAFGASERQLLLRVVLPGALPLTMAGVRLGMGRAVKGVITGEMLIVSVGLGAQLRAYGGAFDAASVLAILLVVIVIAAVASSLVQALDRRLTWWAD